MLKWNASLALGYPDIDQQHQELFARVSRLVSGMERGDLAEAQELFDFLGEYVVLHFGAEELLMREAGFAGYGVHKAAHDRFVRDITDLRLLFESSGASPAVAIKAKTWLVDWLRAHIGGADQMLARHLLRRAG